MVFLSRVFALTLVAFAPAAYADLDPQALRFLSFAIRDVPPTRAEAEAWATAAKPLDAFVDEWLATPEHVTRAGRFFGELLGVSNGTRVGRGHLVLKTGDGGAMRLPGKPDCTAEEAVTVNDAWWLAEGTTTQVCPNTISAVMHVGSGKARFSCVSNGSQGIVDPACGCGPAMMLCIPSSKVPLVRSAVITELARRGAEAYAKDWSWHELLGGSSYFGDRYGYWRYMFTQFGLIDDLPTEADFKNWRSLPLEGLASAPLPTGAARAGIMTSPGFLSQNNNFRARTRALVEGLLCRTIDATLNTAGYTDLANPDLKKSDLKHTERSDCAACHLFLDNIGPAFFAFDGDGEVRIPALKKSTAARAFGESGSGPAFMAHAIVDLGPGFGACMARRAWENFAGTAYELVAEEDRTAFESAAAGGPRAMLQMMLRSNPFLSARAASVATNLPTVDATDAPIRSFDTVAPIFAARCGDSSCHGAGSAISVFEDHPKNVDAAAKRILGRITLEATGRMPPGDSGRVLSAEEKALLVQYLETAP